MPVSVSVDEVALQPLHLLFIRTSMRLSAPRPCQSVSRCPLAQEFMRADEACQLRERHGGALAASAGAKAIHKGQKHAMV
jgi:hypothetical protein